MAVDVGFPNHGSVNDNWVETQSSLFYSQVGTFFHFGVTEKGHKSALLYRKCQS